MRTALVMAVFAVTASGCALDADNVSTRLVKVCTHEVPLAFQRASATDTVATQAVDVSATASYDAPDAVVTLHDLTLARASGDFSFADSLTVTISAPGSGLPDADLAELAPVPDGSSIRATGDGAVNMAPYITAETVSVRLDLHGSSVPRDTVPVSLTACLDVDGVEISE